MIWMPVEIMEITYFFQNLTFGNLLVMIKYKLIVLKISQLTKCVLQGNFYTLINKPAKVRTG